MMPGASTHMTTPFLEDAAKYAVGGGGLGGGIVAARWFLLWLTGRHDQREATLNAKDDAIDERWAKYTKKMEERCDKLEERCQRLEQEVEDCHRDKRDLESRIAKLEGFDNGLGERRQQDQVKASLDSVVGRKLGKA